MGKSWFPYYKHPLLLATLWYVLLQQPSSQKLELLKMPAFLRLQIMMILNPYSMSFNAVVFFFLVLTIRPKWFWTSPKCFAMVQNVFHLSLKAKFSSEETFLVQSKTILDWSNQFDPVQNGFANIEGHGICFKNWFLFK